MDGESDYLEIALRVLTIVATGAAAWQGFRTRSQEGTASFAKMLTVVLFLLFYFVGLAFLAVGVFLLDTTLEFRLLIASTALLWGAGGFYALTRLGALPSRKAPAANAADKDTHAR